MNKFFSSVRCAFHGIAYAWENERNMRVHTLVFMLVLLAAFILEISEIELLIILLVSALTFSLELANTAIERLADKISPGYDKKIGMIKDVMAGAVLVSSLFSVVIGLIIFTPPLLKWLQL